MKIEGKGNELTVELEPGEIPSLLSGELKNNARIYDYDDRLHNVPFSLSFSEGIQDIAVLTRPESSYLPESTRIDVHIGSEKYGMLLDKGFTGTRFGSGGKISLSDKTLER